MKPLPSPSTVAYDPAVNMARQSLYRFAALALVDPQTGCWADLDALRKDAVLREAAALIRSLPEAHVPNLGPGERPLEQLDPAAVLDQLPHSARALNDAYERTFGLLVSGACPPYETEYIDGKFTFQRSNTLADISGFYAAFGLAVASGHPERPDHIMLELEFMAFLLGHERDAAIGDIARRSQRLKVCRAGQTKFLQEHLAWWVPAFAKLLGREDHSGYYAAVGTFLAALVAAERGILNVAAASRNVTPSAPEASEACDGCQLSA